LCMQRVMVGCAGCLLHVLAQPTSQAIIMCHVLFAWYHGGLRTMAGVGSTKCHRPGAGFLVHVAGGVSWARQGVPILECCCVAWEPQGPVHGCWLHMRR
jgi:hypothetical protein